MDAHKQGTFFQNEGTFSYFQFFYVQIQQNFTFDFKKHSLTWLVAAILI